MIAFKFLAAGATGPFTSFRWPTPGGEATPWVDARDARADHGIHACRVEDLAFWLHDELWIAELRDPIAIGHRQVIGRQGRLVERVTAWDRSAARRFAEACAWRARDRFVVTLRAGALGEEASRLAAARDLDALRAASRALRGGAGAAAAASSYLRDALDTLEAGDEAVSAYVSARAAVAASGGEEAAFSREREEQGRWLAGALGIDQRPPHGGRPSDRGSSCTRT